MIFAKIFIAPFIVLSNLFKRHNNNTNFYFIDCDALSYIYMGIRRTRVRTAESKTI